jgi:hypothetical protein
MTFASYVYTFYLLQNFIDFCHFHILKRSFFISYSVKYDVIS